MEEALEENIGIKHKPRIDELGYASDSDEDQQEYRERVEQEEASDDADDFGAEPLEKESKPKSKEWEGEEGYDGSGDGSDDDGMDGEEREDVSYYLHPETVHKSQPKHTPKIEKYNLDEEREEGGYDEMGNFVRQAGDSDGAKDSWLQGVDDKRSIRKAKKAQEKRQRIEAEKQAQPTKDSNEMLKELVFELEVGESPMEALGRLNGQRQRWKRQKEQPIPEELLEQIEHITECAEEWMSKADIYQMSREEISRYYSRLTNKSLDISTNKRKRDDEFDGSSWEFKWDPDTDEIQGPFGTKEMDEWVRYGYFDDAEVVVRAAGTSDFKPLSQVF